MEKPVIEFKNIGKSFSGNAVLEGISFSIQPGEIHAIMGENGAGKSTLLNILHGIYTPTAGEVFLAGERTAFSSIQDAIEKGIFKVHQEVSVIPALTVGQNITLGYEPQKGLFVDYARLNEETDAILQRLKCHFRSTDKASKLSTGEMQMLAIAKALFHKAQVISFDEPTAALSDNEVNAFFDVVRELKASGITIIYVTHRLNEIFQIVDRVSILRDGRYIGTYKVADITREQLIKSMVGRDVAAFAVRQHQGLVQAETVLEVRNLAREGVFSPVSFQLHKGELLGFAGLVGAKRTDVMRVLFGADKKTSGEIFVKGRKAEIKSPVDALRQGIGLIPENRKTQGMVRMLTNADNVGLASIKKFCRLGFVNHAQKQKNCETFIEQINLSPRDPLYITENLSGGNQQKVVIAKWLSTDADILIFDEPTKGVDVGAKAEIYRLMEELLAKGKSIIMVSSEMMEIIGMSDRVLVMREGSLEAELSREELTEERVLHFAMGGEDSFENECNAAHK